MPEYEYPDLDTTQKQIRLLRLRHRGHHGHLPQYELTTFDLETAPPYTALSYTWGPVSPAYPIRVNRRKVNVRANLYAFLEGVPTRDYIWIDQVCINQSNPEEKNHQVRMMAQIYKDCNSMIIWLGSNDQEFKEAADEFRYKPRPQALSVLLNDNYFTRLWVVQEVLLARAVQIFCRGISGIVELPWNEVHAVATGSALWLQEHGQMKAVHTKAIIALMANQGMNRYEGLRVTISRFSGHNCENPRDKVYGLLGIVKPKERLEVDYTKSVQEVFLDAARAVHSSKMEKPDRVNCRARLEWLAGTMGLHSEDKGLTGLRGMLQDVFGSKITARSRLAKLDTRADAHLMGFEPARDGAGLSDDKSKRRLARWWCEHGGKKYYHTCCVCTSTHMCRCNPGKAIIRKTLEFPFVAEGVQLTARQKQALAGAASNADSAKMERDEAIRRVKAENQRIREEVEKRKAEAEAEAKTQKVEAEMQEVEVGLIDAIGMLDEADKENSQAVVVRPLGRTDSLAVETGA
ncbi:hypothetical protein E8E13_006944 [Curvularia kusanoi]|uniref:Heterokaryon incompatibility domain-containing protein n=1 Tax=Curvularia kusanoi TaxID=90978 RepID=A0A9P4TC36_CURKU|nr:hypothetical protein E8E13_006944 [Curvularia kusanoi]